MLMVVFKKKLLIMEDKNTLISNHKMHQLLDGFMKEFTKWIIMPNSRTKDLSGVKEKI